MNQKRKEIINVNVQLILKNRSADEIGFLGILLTNIIKKRAEMSELERGCLIEMLYDLDEEFFEVAKNKFLSEIIYNEEELQYFVSEMQKNIVKELENEENTFSDEDIEKLRGFFTLEALESCNANKKNCKTRKLIIAVWCNENIIMEEFYGISEQIDELIGKINEFQSKEILDYDLKKALDVINDLKEYLESEKFPK